MKIIRWLLILVGISLTISVGRSPTPAAAYSAGVYAVTFSPDNRYIATGWENGPAESGSARVWDVQSGAVVKDLDCETDHVFSLAFSPDLKYFACGGYMGTVLFDGMKWTKLRTLPLHMENNEPLNGMGDVYYVAFTPDSKYLLSASYGGARLWNVRTGALVHRFWDGEYDRSAALSPDGRYVLTKSEKKGVWLWDSQTGRFLQRFTPGTDISPVLTSYASPFSPDGQRVMIGGYDGLHIWDIKARKDAQVFDHRSSAGMYSPDGKYALGYSVLGLQVWDTQTGQVLHEFGKQEAAGEFSPNGELLLTIEGGTFSLEQIFRLYEVPSWKELRHLAGSFTLTSVRAFSPDSRYLIIGYLGSHAEIWSVDSGTLVHDLK